MLKQLTFTNFKPWAEADLCFRQLTGIFGHNSSGKTSLLQFLLMLKQTKDEPDRARPLKLRGNLVDLGLIKDTIHNHDLSRNVTFDLALELPKKFPVWDSYQSKEPFLRGKNLRVSAEIGVENGELQARRLCYKLDGESFWMERKNGKSRNEFQLGPLLGSGQEGAFGFVKNRGRSWPLPAPIKSYAFPDQVNAYFQNAGFLSRLVGEYEKQMDEIFYLGPLRIPPERGYLWSGARPTDVGKGGENVVEAILAATRAGETRNIRQKAKRKTFQEMIAHCLREMKLVENLRVKEIAEGSDLWQLHVRTQKASRDVAITDVGFGIPQVLPVVTLLQYVPEGTTVILEQPEIHLHPCAQSELADVIIQAVTHRKVQVIMESHSELLLLRLQRRIAENSRDQSISEKDVALYFCDMQNGISKLENLQIDSNGNIENWPDNFMGDAFGETSKAELARLKRKKTIIRKKKGRHFVIDTNVLVVANRQSDKNGRSRSPVCETKPIEFLNDVHETGIVFLDDVGEIVREYDRNLNPYGRQLGSGDQFYILLIRQGMHTKEVKLSCRNGEYEVLLLEIIDKGFDPDDRVFAALAKKKNASVANAVDSDWLIKLALLNKHHICVLFVCGKDESCWH